MKTTLYWVSDPSPGRVAIMPRPRGGDWLEDEVLAWREAGIDVVVSLLTPDEIDDLGLVLEQELCRQNGIQFVSLPIEDRCVPDSREAFTELIGRLAEACVDGKNIGVHCRQGIGRAGVVAVSLLIRMGLAPEAAIERVSFARGYPVPETPEQRQWVINFARLSKSLPG